MSSNTARQLGGILDLSEYGITGVTEILHNPSFEVLFAEETRDDLQGFERAVLTDTGAVAVDTGEFTGRSPKDKYICLLYTSPSPRDATLSRMPSSA